MPVNPAYRGFLAALAAVERGEDQWAAYERHYLAPNRAVLTAYWQECWGTDEAHIRQATGRANRSRHRALRDALEDANVDELAAGAVARCASLIDLPEPQVDLLVGRFSPDAFVFRVGDAWHIGVGLERFEEFSGLPLLIAHEYGHYARKLLLQASDSVTVGERIVSEGTAINFAGMAYPEAPLEKLLRMSARRLHEIRELERTLWAQLGPHLREREERDFAGVVGGPLGWCGFPQRFGCYLGYVAVREYAQARGLSPASREVLGAPAEAVLARPSGS